MCVPLNYHRMCLSSYAIFKCVYVPIIVCAHARSVSLFALIHLVGVGLLKELHDGGVAAARGTHESSVAILYIYTERETEGQRGGRLSERQKRGTRVPARRAWFGVCGEWELAKSLHVKSTRGAHTQLGENLKFAKWTFSNIEK